VSGKAWTVAPESQPLRLPEGEAWLDSRRFSSTVYKHWTNAALALAL
jgi:hypothetical protein